MAESLKEKNLKWLIIAILANFAIFYLTAHTQALQANEFAEIVSDWHKALPVGASVLAGTLLNGLLSRDFKARIVFWRWSYPLPSRLAFSKHAREEQRVDFAILQERFGDLPVSPEGQSSLWYRIYKSHENDLAVTQAHRDYLLLRDWCALSFLFLIVLGPVSFFLVVPKSIAASYSGLLLLQYAVTMIAARNYAASLIRNVLAIETGSSVN